MKIMKRALVSITRRKLNSLVLLLIVFILANVLLTTLTVTSSLKNTKEMVLKQFPPTVSIDYNTEYGDIEKIPKLSVEMAEQLYREANEYIKQYDYSLFINLTKTNDIKYAYLQADDNELIRIKELSNAIVLKGTQLPATSLVEKGEAKLLSGKGFTEADIKEGKPKVVITKYFAEANGLDVGSNYSMSRTLCRYDHETGTLAEPFFSEDIELEVVGILEINEIEDFLTKQTAGSDENMRKAMELQDMANEAYVVNSFIHPLLKDNIDRAKEFYKKDYKGIPGVSQNLNIYPEFMLKDMKNLDAFLVVAKGVYNEKQYTIKSAASEYEAIAKPMKSMEDLLNLVFKITVFASIVIMTLVLYIFMYLRQKEMGVFLALGEHRVKIFGQLFLETMIIALIGASLAILTASIFSNMLTENTVNSLLEPSKALSTTIQTMGTSYGITPEAISQQVQGGFSIMTFVIFYGTMILTIFISQMATVLYLLRLNPKKILM